MPPTAYEWGGGYFGHDEQAQFMAESLMVTGLDEVMDWPAVWNAENPSHGRLWGMIEATFAARGVVEGHAAGLRALPEINAFAAAGMASDHEMFTAEEAWAHICDFWKDDPLGVLASSEPEQQPECWDWSPAAD